MCTYPCLCENAQAEAVKRYQAKLDRIVFYLPKGGAAELEAHAKAKGYKSRSEYLQDLIRKDLEAGG